MRARLAAAYSDGRGRGGRGGQPVGRAAPGQTALFNQWEDAGVCEVQWPHGADGELLHLPRLRDEHRLCSWLQSVE